MTKLEFEVVSVTAERRTISPAIRFRLRLNAEGDPIAAVALRVRFQIEPFLRDYSAKEAATLQALFGRRERGARWATALQWDEVSTVITQFDGSTEFDLPVSCTYDADVVSSRYFAALTNGEIPVRLFFNGTIFRGAPNGFAVEMLPWDLECTARVSVHTWQDAMNACFPNKAWIRVDRKTYDALLRIRNAEPAAGWDSTLERLLRNATVTQP